MAGVAKDTPLYVAKKSVYEMSIAEYTRQKKHWSGVVGGVRGSTARAVFMDLKRSGFLVEANQGDGWCCDGRNRRYGHCYWFCDDFTLDDDEGEFVRRWVLQQETVAIEQF
jgi:hypothetical protein